MRARMTVAGGEDGTAGGGGGGLVAWWAAATACYHEPKVHDHELYFQLVGINVYVLLPLALLGLFFNAAALICLYSKPKISSGVFTYLKALLILDHCHILVSCANFLLPQLCDTHHSREHTFYRLCMFERKFLKYTLPRIESTVNILHVWTIASLSVHRYWKISRPVVSRFKDTARRARLVLALMFFVLVLYRLPIFVFELQLKWRPILRIIRRPDTTQLLSPYRIVYHSLLDPILSNCLPFAWMCVFSVLTLSEIVKSRHFAYAQFSVDSGGSSGIRRTSFSSTEPLRMFRRRADGMRQKQEFRATISIVLIIVLYMFFHSLQLYNVFRKWQLLVLKKCPTRTDYIQSHVSNVLSMLSASVNAFVFIAFTNRLRLYVQMLIRKTSRSLSSNSSEPPLSPRTMIVSNDAQLSAAAATTAVTISPFAV